MEIRTKDLILRTVTENDIEEIARMWEYPRQRQIFQTPVLKGVDVSFVGKWIKGADKDDVRFLQPCASFSGEDYVTVYIEFVAVRKKIPQTRYCCNYASRKYVTYKLSRFCA